MSNAASVLANLRRILPGTRTRKTQEDRLAPLPAPFRDALLSMYRGEPQLGSDGQLHEINRITRISATHGMWLYDFCLATRPRSIVEIGMAYGFSTLYLLAAIAKNQTGTLTSIDPYQTSLWKGIGRTHAQKLDAATGSAKVSRLIEDRSDRASTDLERANETFDLLFIDGNHRFDDVLVDFYLYAPLCSIGGHIVFDDMWMSSIRTVIAFIRANRPDVVELPASKKGYCVFKKIGDYTRKWDEFTRFRVAPSARVNR